MDARKRSPINCTPVLTNYFSLGTCFYQGSTVTKIIPQCSLQMEGGFLGTVSRNFRCGQPALERLEYHRYGSQILDPPLIPPLPPWETPVTVIESVEEKQKDWLGLRNSTKL